MMIVAFSDHHGRAADARGLFDKMPDWDGFLWTLMISRYTCGCSLRCDTTERHLGSKAKQSKANLRWYAVEKVPL
ncbi:hypothetical protein U9M48_021267 [Paspalum notatum var. saurae]|uniref:Pentatricopeptide repeat-containing protein n=1 Tax=Paspalum notatum var. saurae TaxID=547442 RepID=A0AAQ3WTS8_PASNO